MPKKVRQGQTRWILNCCPPQYTVTGYWWFYITKAFITKKKFNQVNVNFQGIGNIVMTEARLLRCTYKSKGGCLKKLERMIPHIEWMYDKCFDDTDVQEWIMNTVRDKEK